MPHRHHIPERRTGPGRHPGPADGDVLTLPTAGLLAHPAVREGISMIAKTFILHGGCCRTRFRVSKLTRCRLDVGRGIQMLWPSEPIGQFRNSPQGLRFNPLRDVRLLS